MGGRSDYQLPARRPLKIFAFDPMLRGVASNRVVLHVRREELLPGPIGARVEVIDYDTAQGVFYKPVDLDHPAVLGNQGLDPSESDPRFHQQMVYAVTMRVIETFEEALGRRISFRGRPLRLFPHAFQGANAYFHPQKNAVFFGYFVADAHDPGSNLPGQTVFNCLSHDVIVHEVTHALVHRLRRRFGDMTNEDVGAFHEAFSDIVAIFQHFSYPAMLAEVIQKTRGDLSSPSVLGELAQQFGYATGTGQALRSAVTPVRHADGRAQIEAPDATLIKRTFEAHERGSILVSAVFDAFFVIYQGRIRDLVRIATGGTGRLPDGDLHPDLVGRIAREASRTARMILKMCIRAIEYLPPCDVTFGDFLRALVTADKEAVPDDENDVRAALIEAFRKRGIYPVGVDSLADDALVWPDIEEKGLKLPIAPFEQDLVASAQAFDRGPRDGSETERKAARDALHGRLAVTLTKWGNRRANKKALGLSPAHKTELDGFHTVFRVSPDGQLIVEFVVRFVQEDKSVRNDPSLGGLRVWGGVTVIASAHGSVRYLISKEISATRLEAIRKWVQLSDAADAQIAFADPATHARRMSSLSFRQMHRGLR